jgi:hypothetical protein
LTGSRLGRTDRQTARERTGKARQESTTDKIIINKRGQRCEAILRHATPRKDRNRSEVRSQACLLPPPSSPGPARRENKIISSSREGSKRQLCQHQRLERERLWFPAPSASEEPPLDSFSGHWSPSENNEGQRERDSERERQTERERERDRETERETERERERETERARETERQTERERQRETERETERERGRDRERETERGRWDGP